MLKKKVVKSRQSVKVTFEIPVSELPEGVEIASVHLVGDFNDWQTDSTEMRLLKRGAFSVTLELEPGVEYQYRYLINGERWYNDWQADRYVNNELGSDNCCVLTPAEE